MRRCRCDALAIRWADATRILDEEIIWADAGSIPVGALIPSYAVVVENEAQSSSLRSDRERGAQNEENPHQPPLSD